MQRWGEQGSLPFIFLCSDPLLVFSRVLLTTYLPCNSSCTVTPSCFSFSPSPTRLFFSGLLHKGAAPHIDCPIPLMLPAMQLRFFFFFFNAIRIEALIFRSLYLCEAKWTVSHVVLWTNENTVIQLQSCVIKYILYPPEIVLKVSPYQAILKIMKEDLVVKSACCCRLCTSTAAHISAKGRQNPKMKWVVLIAQ